jgi:hypothetical protein
VENQVDYVKAILSEITGAVSDPISKKLDLQKWERVADKLGSFSSCVECQNHLLELTNYLIQLKATIDRKEEIDFKQHKKYINEIVSHLQKKHEMVQEGYYLGLYMSLGVSLGVVFGLTIFDNIGLGIPIGMCIGLAIGAGLDGDAKKKGKII